MIIDIELERAQEKARSFPDLKPPGGARFIGTIISPSGEKSYYYKDDNNNYYYETESGFDFKLRMEEIKKKRRFGRR